MEANKIQIGDWVMAYGIDHPVKVAGIDAEYEGDVWVKIQDGATVYSESLFNINPIPITEEILEKNGFKDAPAKDTDAHNLVGKWWHKSGDVYVKKYCLSHGTYAHTIGFHPHTRIENIHNVHELQHALRLLGIEKEIEL